LAREAEEAAMIAAEEARLAEEAKRLAEEAAAAELQRLKDKIAAADAEANRLAALAAKKAAKEAADFEAKRILREAQLRRQQEEAEAAEALRLAKLAKTSPSSPGPEIARREAPWSLEGLDRCLTPDREKMSAMNLFDQAERGMTPLPSVKRPRRTFQSIHDSSVLNGLHGAGANAETLPGYRPPASRASSANSTRSSVSNFELSKDNKGNYKFYMEHARPGERPKNMDTSELRGGGLGVSQSTPLLLGGGLSASTSTPLLPPSLAATMPNPLAATMPAPRRSESYRRLQSARNDRISQLRTAPLYIGQGMSSHSDDITNDDGVTPHHAANICENCGGDVRNKCCDHAVLAGTHTCSALNARLCSLPTPLVPQGTTYLRADLRRKRISGGH
jgi:hypothetical protein